MQNTTTLNQKRTTIACAFVAILILFGFTKSFGYTVSNLSGTYHGGQVFLTWTNPNVTNLQYNVYRSTSKFTSGSQLNSSTLMGFVRDSSSKNIRLSQQEGHDVFFQIADGGQALLQNQGLYVVTCTSNQSHYYYAVTVTVLSSGVESKAIVAGENSLSTAVTEMFKQPQPVFQFTETEPTGDVLSRYVQFVNNQETSLYPAMNSTGSYGFNFYLLKRGTAISYPLIVFYVGLGADASGASGLDPSFTNCYILGVDDWLPIPNGSGGDNTYYCCYHENFNIYSSNNSIPTSGTVKLYPQKRYIQSIRWVKSHFPIDTTRIYTKGTSAGGFGALLTATLFPNEIAAAYAVVEPMFLKPVGSSADLYKSMWGATASDLQSDFDNPVTGTRLPVYTILDISDMMDVDDNLGLPLIFDVHGKKDTKVAWSSNITNWYDQLQTDHIGGTFYWDQRNHDGTGKNFLAEETTPDFFRYQTTKSYPAFSNCSINQDPGNGTPSSGDPYGAINGYLDWNDDIADNSCDYTIDVFLKDFYVGGVLDPNQFNTCTTDITLRRLQNFLPNIGATIKWKNYDNTNNKIQSGSFVYHGGLITITGIKVNKSGNSIQFKIPNCQRESDVTDDEQDKVYFVRSANGYTAHIDMNADGNILLNVFDLMGRIVEQKNVSLVSGSNTVEIPSAGSGIYLVKIEGSAVSFAGKLLF